MLFKIHEEFTTSVSKEMIYELLASKSGHLANVFRNGSRVNSEEIDTYNATRGSLYWKNSTSITINQKENACLIDASVEHQPSDIFWISNVLGFLYSGFIYLENYRYMRETSFFQEVISVQSPHFSILVSLLLGCGIPLLVYVIQRNSLLKEIETAVRAVRNYRADSKLPNSTYATDSKVVTKPEVKTTTVATRAESASTPIMSTQSASSFTVRDDALERVRANGYWAMRARSSQLTTIGYFQLGVGGIVLFIGIIALFSVLGVSVEIQDQNTWFGYIIALVSFIVAYRMVLNGLHTFLQRDELLMRIDVAMNTALMATQMTILTQHLLAQKKNDD